MRFVLDAGRDLLRSDDRKSVVRRELEVAFTRHNQNDDRSRFSRRAPAVHMASRELT
jgi:hypothetical protein